MARPDDPDQPAAPDVPALLAGRRGDPMAQLAAALDEVATLDETASLVAAAAVELIDPCDAASITVRRSSGRLESWASTSELARGSDDLQHAHTEGPCYVDVRQAIVESPDVEHDERWPAWRGVAAEHRLHSVLSVQLLKRRRPVGALTLYSEQAGRFVEGEEFDLALLFAAHAGLALAAARAEDDFESAVTSRHLIGMAQGVVMARYAIGPEESFAFLKRLSMASNTKISVIADEIVRTRSVDQLGQLSQLDQGR